MTARPAHDSEGRDLQEIRTPRARVPCGHAVACTSHVRGRYPSLRYVLYFPQPGYREIGGSASLLPKSAGDVLNTGVASVVETLLSASTARRAVPWLCVVSLGDFCTRFSVHLCANALHGSLLGAPFSGASVIGTGPACSSYVS